jgi:hypothetical protein
MPMERAKCVECNFTMIWSLGQTLHSHCTHTLHSTHCTHPLHSSHTALTHCTFTHYHTLYLHTLKALTHCTHTLHFTHIALTGAAIEVTNHESEGNNKSRVDELLGRSTPLITSSQPMKNHKGYRLFVFCLFVCLLFVCLFVCLFLFVTFLFCLFVFAFLDIFLLNCHRSPFSFFFPYKIIMSIFIMCWEMLTLSLKC